jgi:kynurenine formamidase
MTRHIIDLSHPLSESTPAFPGDPAPQITVFDSTDRPSVSGERHLNCSHLALSVHCGTHMDAPFHFFGDGATIDRVPLDITMGPALLVRLPWQEVGLTIDATNIAPYADRLRSIPRIVLNTGWHHRFGHDDYFTAHPVITGAAAKLMMDCGVRLVGVDTPSVDRPPYDAHLAILGAGAVIVENLTNLDDLPDEFELIATPIAILGRDGSPVRALAKL